jgi:hypothetical protein
VEARRWHRHSGLRQSQQQTAKLLKHSFVTGALQCGATRQNQLQIIAVQQELTRVHQSIFKMSKKIT